ncbi:helix-turn-helix transcriptional regulator [Phreatobacter stygius]|uniref:Helix-turn-helix transcriptional regulator n=2 Tax=Phreatobacter stygius TaxID=1940610 RepID=A0A4D7B6Q2_9HYPH|nr:helix-turn-helix transcriptional regulator [Phreatobacter stygius]
MLLASVFGAAQAIPALAILPRESAFGRLTGEHMLMLRQCAAGLTQAESQAAIQSLVHLAVGGLAGRRDADAPTVAASQEALLSRIRRHVEDNLGAASLTVDSLCLAFELSRASLYRLFTPDSPANYIQKRRLHRAFAMLISPAFRSWRIIDIALECHFSSDATFIRAFRRQFGITPGDARGLAGRTIGGALPGNGGALLRTDDEAIRWVTQLTGAMPHMRPGQT